MGLGFIGSIQVILMLENGVMGRVMGLEFKLALMLAAMLVSSSVGSSMALVATTSGEFLFLKFWCYLYGVLIIGHFFFFFNV